MSRKEKAESSIAQRDLRKFPIDDFDEGDLVIDDSKLPMTVEKDNVMNLLRNERYLKEIFIFIISHSKGTVDHNKFYALMKKLKIPKIADTCLGMHLVRISCTGDQKQKKKTVIKYLKEKLTEQCSPEEVHIVVAADIFYFDNDFVKKPRRDDNGASGANSLGQGLAKLTLADTEGGKHDASKK